MGPGVGPAGQGHRGPRPRPSPQCGTGAPTDSGTEGRAVSAWGWGWPGSTERAAPCLIPAAALPPLPIPAVLGSTGAAAGTGNGVHGVRRSPWGYGPHHALGWAQWCPYGGRASRSFVCQPCPPRGIGGSSWERCGRGLRGRNGATLMLPAPNRKQAPGLASTSAPNLLTGASRATRDGSGWGCGRGCAPPS